MRKHLLFLFFLYSSLVSAQQIIVPDNLYLADQRMNLSASGKQEIQKKVDALLKYPKYFQAKVALADTYFPIIERVFREEGLPDDFKYLVLIESGLIPDAVSTSNAVGFWQFKKETAIDYGLQVNDRIDERKHIIASSRSAARYLLKSNNLYYKNWHNTILSYYYGFTGAKAFAKPEHVNRKEMEITDKTDIYILKLLAHKVAYEGAIGRNPAPAVVLQEIPVSGKSLSELALETAVSEAELQQYNKWLATTFIPSDKTYTVMVPVTNPEHQSLILASRRASGPRAAQAEAPVVVAEKAGKREIKKLNGLKVIIARRGDTKDQLALQARLSTRKFLAFNDMHSFDPIEEGQAYYIERKKSKAQVPYHVVKPGERVQQIAQKYGVKVRSILWYNRMKANEVLATGRLLWMQRRRPSDIPIEFQKTYPDTEPTRAPSNPVIIAQDEVLDEINADNSTTSSQVPSAARPPVRDYAGGKLSGTSPAKAGNSQAPEPTPAEPIEEENDQDAHPIDVALSHTNEEEDKNEVLLTEEIDQQVEHINQPAPTIYRKMQTGQTVATSTDQARQNTPLPAGQGQQASPAKPAPSDQPQPAVARSQSAEIPKQTAPELPVAAPPVKSPEVAGQAVLPPTPGIHVVARGETLYGISRKYGITIEDLQNWNNLGDQALVIDQRLKVVAPAGLNSSSVPVSPADKPQLAGSSSPTTHIVSSGESMYQISRRYGVTIKDIMEWNGKADFNVIPGEKLLIKTVTNSRQ